MFCDLVARWHRRCSQFISSEAVGATERSNERSTCQVNTSYSSNVTNITYHLSRNFWPLAVCTCAYTNNFSWQEFLQAHFLI